MNTLVADVVQTIWQSVLGRDVELVDAVTPNDHIPDGLTACIQISGAWSGAVVASFPESLARKFAATMLDASEDSASPDDLRDTLGEIVNMIGGNLKATLPSPSHLSLPWVTSGHDVRVSFPHAKALDGARFVCEGEPLIVRVVQTENPEALAAGARAE